MRYYLIIALLAIFLVAPLVAQEEDADAVIENVDTADKAVSEESVSVEAARESAAVAEKKEPEEPEEPDKDEDLIDLDNPEDADLDEQGYEEDEDDFVPTQEIPADTPIPFPSNI